MTIPLTLRGICGVQAVQRGTCLLSFEADVVAIVQAADEPFNLFGASCRSFILRPLIGIITKIDSPYANIPMVKQC